MPDAAAMSLWVAVVIVAASCTVAAADSSSPSLPSLHHGRGAVPAPPQPLASEQWVDVSSEDTFLSRLYDWEDRYNTRWGSDPNDDNWWLLTNYSTAINNNTVLQRAPASAVLWGWSDPGDFLRITFRGKRNWIQGDMDGKWSVQLPPTPAGGPYSITTWSQNRWENLTIHNVMFGDVYLCGGQSNMALPLEYIFNATQEIALAPKYPNVRLMVVDSIRSSTVPLRDVPKMAINWTMPTVELLPYFSAVCWLTGRRIFDALGGKVPIGLIESQWGGTPVQAWSSPDALAKCPQPSSTHLSSLRGESPPQAPSVLWNAMIAPLTPMRLKGFLWYQGEQNVGNASVVPTDGPKYYSCQFPAMIQDWRAKFGLGDEAPFVFVQLAPYCVDVMWCNSTVPRAGLEPELPLLRQAQLAALKLPNVAAAITIDAGDITAPLGSVHPRDKEVVGHRLALAAMALGYGAAEAHVGPTVASVSIVESDVSQAWHMLEVQYASSTATAFPVAIRSDACPSVIQAAYCSGAGFTVRSAHTGRWSVASSVTLNAQGNGTSVLVNTTVADPSEVGYAFADWPLSLVYSANGLPAVPFTMPVANKGRSN